jgi:hypothetical protein
LENVYFYGSLSILTIGESDGQRRFIAQALPHI